MGLPVGSLVSDASLGDWAAAAGALFTALAALAAYLTARQGRQLIEAAELPRLDVQVLVDPESGMLMLSVVNAGRGIGRGSGYVLHALGRVAVGILGDGFMQSGEKLFVRSAIGPVPT